MKIIRALAVATSVIVASMILTPVVSPDSLIWYLAILAGITGGLAQSIGKRRSGK